jgi:bifunctional UDP-N-acetylglucosamine pyrophosphorylase/glucosamine-1-phosphate N-acetyltransferase
MANPLAVVMAAGQGTRMESDLPKVLVDVCGRPMIHYVLDALAKGGIEQVIVVVGYRADDVRRELAGREGVSFALQEEQLGTGHAVMACREFLQPHDGPVLVVAGDSPMIQASSIAKLIEAFGRDHCACLMGTAHKEDPTGLGRVVRDQQGEFQAIVEEKDATPAQRQITEVNMTTYVFDCQSLLGALSQLRSDNAQGEYYVTDCPGILKSEGRNVQALDALTPGESLSINNMKELAIVEAEMRRTDSA